MASSSHSARVAVVMVMAIGALIAFLRLTRPAPQPAAFLPPDVGGTTNPSAASVNDPPPATVADTEREVRAVCARLVECAAGKPSPDAVEGCVQKNMQQAADAFSRSVVTSAYRSVRQECGKTPCDGYMDCYMDSLKRKTAELLGGAPPQANIAPATRKRIVQLVCKVSREHPGRVPDLGAPDASPEAVELRGLLGGVQDPGAIADIMKEALAACEAK
jgi:hypothetical protein